MIEPGALRTSGLPNSVIIPPHAAYSDPKLELPSLIVRTWLKKNRDTLPGNPCKAAEKIFELTKLSIPPKRLVLGCDAIELVVRKLRTVDKDLNEYRSWSQDLNFTDDGGKTKTVFQN